MISLNWSGSVLNSGSSFCDEPTSLVNGTTTDEGQGNSNCFNSIPDYSEFSGDAETQASSSIHPLNMPMDS